MRYKYFAFILNKKNTLQNKDFWYIITQGHAEEENIHWRGPVARGTPHSPPSAEYNAYKVRNPFTLKGGDHMKALAGHHWSAETVLVGSVVLGLGIGAAVGFFIGSLLIDNVGVGISLGTLGGLIAGIILGVMYADSQE